jgi:hypothetical protein
MAVQERIVAVPLVGMKTRNSITQSATVLFATPNFSTKSLFRSSIRPSASSIGLSSIPSGIRLSLIPINSLSVLFRPSDLGEEMSQKN